MGSSYTDNNKFEKIGTGEQAGTWGTTTNLNFDMIDRAINGVTSIGLTGTTSTITTSDGTLTDGLFKVLQFTGSLSAGHTVTIAPNSVKKLYFVKNASGDTVTFIQGTGGTVGNGRAVAIENNKTGIIFCDGTGSDSTAKVQKIETGSDEFTTDVNIKTNDGALLTLQTGDTTITDGDVLGALQFQAPSESDGDGDASSDSIKVTASIIGEADATFSDTVNSTDLVFKLATDGDAAEKMRLTHEGDLNLITDGKSINFGADSEIQLTHVADTGLTLTHTATGAGTPVVLNLKSEEDAIADGDVIGKITFTAGDDSGTDAIATAASIEAEADDTFAADSNKTDLVFKLGSSEAATEKMRLAHEGILSIPADSAANGASNSIHLGASADLKIYHDSSNSYVDDTGQGALILNGSTVHLYHGGANKLQTTDSGVTCTGDITAFSDERLKSDIQTIDNALDKVMNMRGVSYTKQAEKGIGVIAQEIEKVLPEVVTDGEYKSVAYGNIVGVLIEAIKEQQKQIDELKKDK